MRRLEDNPYLTWFKLAIGLGILANVLFALPAVFSPYWLLDQLRLPWTKDVIWLRFAGALLFFLGLMYLGAARDPFRYRLNACLAVLGRVVFGVFWLWTALFTDLPQSFLWLGIVDTVLAVLQVVTYSSMMRYEYMNPELSEFAG